MKTDAQLLAHVAEELAFDPSVDASHIAIAVCEGIVGLTGPTRSYWQKVEAEKSVLRVGGVRGVVNELEVVIPAMSHRDDGAIAKASADVLEWHSDLPKTIHATVKNGWIILVGSVDWNFQREEAERAVRYVTGAKGVIDKIAIRQFPKVSDVRERIREELERTVDREGNRIQIEATNDRVTLKGAVHSWLERDAARRAAWSVPGVKEVENQLTVLLRPRLVAREIE